MNKKIVLPMRHSQRIAHGGNTMTKLYRKCKDLLSMYGHELKCIIGVVSTGLFGLVGLGTWLIGLLIGSYIDSKHS